ncbi:MAG: hypothetical protein Q8S13_07485, partial [Dehalococcoidia bacterium]|nr:hypothetical protein [Dehalococcoidia bacterium]
MAFAVAESPSAWGILHANEYALGSASEAIRTDAGLLDAITGRDLRAGPLADMALARSYSAAVLGEAVVSIAPDRSAALGRLTADPVIARSIARLARTLSADPNTPALRASLVMHTLAGEAALCGGSPSRIGRFGARMRVLASADVPARAGGGLGDLGAQDARFESAPGGTASKTGFPPGTPLDELSPALRAPVRGTLRFYVRRSDYILTYPVPPGGRVLSSAKKKGQRVAPTEATSFVIRGPGVLPDPTERWLRADYADDTSPLPDGAIIEVPFDRKVRVDLDHRGAIGFKLQEHGQKSAVAHACDIAMPFAPGTCRKAVQGLIDGLIDSVEWLAQQASSLLKRTLHFLLGKKIGDVVYNVIRMMVGVVTDAARQLVAGVTLLWTFVSRLVSGDPLGAVRALIAGISEQLIMPIIAPIGRIAGMAENKIRALVKRLSEKNPLLPLNLVTLLLSGVSANVQGVVTQAVGI